MGSNPYGFSIFQYTNSTPLDSFAITDILNTGATWVRYQAPWSNIEQSNGVYTWTYLDAVVQQLNSAGLNITLTIQGAPAWHLNQTCGSSSLPGASDASVFASQLAQRYNGTAGHGIVQEIEIGNEEWSQASPNCNDWTTYIAVLKAASYEIRQYHPTCKIGTAALLQRSTTITNAALKLFFQNGGPIYADYLNFHYYNAPNGPLNGDIFAPNFAYFLFHIQQMCALYGYPGFPIHCTETGWATNTNAGQSNIVDPATQAQFYQYVLDAARQGGLPRLNFYTIGAKGTDGTTSDGMSITQGYPPTETHLPAYNLVKNYITQYPQWTATANPAIPAVNVNLRTRGGNTPSLSQTVTNQIANLYVNDFLPVLRCTFMDDQSRPIDLSNLWFTPTFLNSSTSPIQLYYVNITNNVQKTGGGIWTILDAKNGVAQYAPSGTDTNNAGTFGIWTILEFPFSPLHFDPVQVVVKTPLST